MRLRRTLHDVSKDEAEQALAALRAKANRGEARPDLVAPTLRDFYTSYFDLIAESIAPSTAEGYRNVIVCPVTNKRRDATYQRMRVSKEIART